jgi:hypothetical protein
MDTEIHYTHLGTAEGESGLWIGVTVSRVTPEQQRTVESVLERCRDELVATLGLWGDP